MYNLTDRHQHIIETIVKETQTYSKQYNCPLLEAFEDCIKELPTRIEHAKMAAITLGLNIPDSWFKKNTVPMDYDFSKDDYSDY